MINYSFIDFMLTMPPMLIIRNSDHFVKILLRNITNLISAGLPFTPALYPLFILSICMIVIKHSQYHFDLMEFQSQLFLSFYVFSFIQNLFGLCLCFSSVMLDYWFMILIGISSELEKLYTNLHWSFYFVRFYAHYTALLYLT